jgi:hypothetical protein
VTSGAIDEHRPEEGDVGCRSSERRPPEEKETTHQIFQGRLYDLIDGLLGIDCHRDCTGAIAVPTVTPEWVVVLTVWCQHDRMPHCAAGLSQCDISTNFHQN